MIMAMIVRVLMMVEVLILIIMMKRMKLLIIRMVVVMSQCPNQPNTLHIRHGWTRSRLPKKPAKVIFFQTRVTLPEKCSTVKDLRKE